MNCMEKLSNAVTKAVAKTESENVFIDKNPMTKQVCVYIFNNKNHCEIASENLMPVKHIENHAADILNIAKKNRINISESLLDAIDKCCA